MNIDPEKVKELVLVFSKLDDDYQKELMKQAYILSLKQSQKNLIAKEKKKFKNDMDYEKEIEDRSNKRAAEALEMVKMFIEMTDDKKAELIILLDNLSGGGMTKKTDIEIKINQGRVSLKDYLEELLPGTDFKAANKNVENHLKEMGYK